MKNLLSQDQLKNLAGVITEVEMRTSGELRLIIVRRSSRTSHVFPLLAFAFATIGMLYLWQTRHMLMLGVTSWLAPIVLIVSAGLAYLLSRLPVVQRRLTWPADLEHQVLSRAELEFHHEGLGATADKTGILIFLSVLEHQAVVLADKGIVEKLDRSVWNQVVAIVLEGARNDTLHANLETAIRKCGDLLHKHFPIKAGDKNELPNHVIVKE